MKILFVCLGNICRSPMAEMIAKDYVINHKIDNIIIDSCGTSSYHKGEWMHHKTENTLLKNNIFIDKNFKSKPINDELLNESDLVIVMDNENYSDVLNMFPKYTNKVKKMVQYLENENYDHIPDPWYTNNFDETFRLLKNAISNLLK